MLQDSLVLPARYCLLTWNTVLKLLELLNLDGASMRKAPLEHCTKRTLPVRFFLHGALIVRQRQQREIIPVEVVRQVKHPWKASSGVDGLPGLALSEALVPRSIC